MRRWQQLLLILSALVTLGAHIPAVAAVPAMPATDVDCMEMMAPQQHGDDGSTQDKSSPMNCMTALGCSMPAMTLADPVMPFGPDIAGNSFDTPIFTHLFGTSQAPETHPPTYLG